MGDRHARVDAEVESSTEIPLKELCAEELEAVGGGAFPFIQTA